MASDVEHDQHGRPSSDRDGACICDYNPSTTDGPQEDCPFHGRPYAYWIERGDELADRLAAAEGAVARCAALRDRWARRAGEAMNPDSREWLNAASSSLRAALATGATT